MTSSTFYTDILRNRLPIADYFLDFVVFEGEDFLVVVVFLVVFDSTFFLVLSAVFFSVRSFLSLARLFFMAGSLFFVVLPPFPFLDSRNCSPIDTHSSVVIVRGSMPLGRGTFVSL